jgi:segregation and condensation protein B
MAIGQFMRLTMHNFRMFWSASFSASNRMLVVMAEDEGRATMDERDAIVSEDEGRTTKNERPRTNAGDELVSPDPEHDMGGAPDGKDVIEKVVGESRINEDVVTPALDGEIASVDDEKDEWREEAGDEPKAPVADPSTADAIVQGEFELDEDALPPEIQIESHGRQLGLTTLLESLLFVSDEPVEASQLAKALNLSAKQVATGLHRLGLLYRNDERGLRLQVRAGRYQLVTAPETAAAIEDFLNLDLTSKLSGPALETLAVVAYRQPATRAQIEAVRGVDCAGVLRSLGQRGLIEEVGRLDAVGRPILYGVTDLFMQHFGLIDLGELPPLESDDEDMLWAATKLAEMEQDKR